MYPFSIRAPHLSSSVYLSSSVGLLFFHVPVLHLGPLPLFFHLYHYLPCLLLNPSLFLSCIPSPSKLPVSIYSSVFLSSPVSRYLFCYIHSFAILLHLSFHFFFFPPCICSLSMLSHVFPSSSVCLSSICLSFFHLSLLYPDTPFLSSFIFSFSSP